MQVIAICWKKSEIRNENSIVVCVAQSKNRTSFVTVVLKAADVSFLLRRRKQMREFE